MSWDASQICFWTYGNILKFFYSVRNTHCWRNGIMRLVNRILASEIDAWAKQEPRQAQEILPELIIRLILATSKKIENFHFPIEKGIQYAGYDGTLTSSEITNYFPQGKSVWEFGTNEDAIGKFNDDISKRSQNPLGVDITNSVFIFATIKIWNHQTSIEEAINDAKTKYVWKDIRIIDAQTISLWLENCLSVTVWLSKIIGKHIEGLVSIEAFWDNKASSTSPCLVKEYFEVGRESQISDLRKWLDDPKEYLVLKSESSLESILFFISVVMGIEEQKKYNVVSNCIIVETTSAWNESIKSANEQTILIPTFNFTDGIQCSGDVCYILPISKFSPCANVCKNSNTVDLPKWRQEEFYSALKLMGFDIGEHNKIETATKRSFLPFYRMVTTVPMRKVPKWTTMPNLRELIPMMLIGGLNTNYADDKKIIEQLSGISCDEYLSDLSPWLDMEDSPVFCILNNYQVVSVSDLWNQLYRLLNGDDIEKLKNCIIEVFQVTDPALDLPEKQQLFASLLGKTMSYSHSALNGLIVSLIMLSERNNETNNMGISSTKGFVDGIIMNILNKVDTWQHWKTITSSLTLLTEASPSALLEKIEKEVSEDSSEFWSLFELPEDISWGRTYYTHVLWSLENLMWQEDYVVRAIHLLARIAEKKFEYKMVNSPYHSLYEIFCLWHPQSCLNFEERQILLSEIIMKYPHTGWRLIEMLLPHRNQICGNISRPKWQDGVYNNISVTGKEHYDSCNYLINLVVEIIDDDTEHWAIVFKSISLFVSQLDVLNEKCSKFCMKMNEEKLLKMCELLREQIYNFRKFCNAAWSIDEQHVAKLENLLNSIEPNNIIKYKYLFKNCPHILNPEPYIESGNSDNEHDEVRIYGLREKCVLDIFETYGLDKMISFFTDIQDVMNFAKIFTYKIFEFRYDFSLLKKIKQYNYNLFSAILWQLSTKNDIPTLISLIKDYGEFSENEIGEILCNYPMSLQLWTEVDKFTAQVENNYWENIKVFNLDNPTEGEMDYYIEKLLIHNRPFSLIRLLAYSDYNNPQRIIEILEKSVELQEQTERDGSSLKLINVWEFMKMFEKLYKIINVDEQKVIQLELAYLPYFRFNGEPKCLITYLTNNPVEFVRLITKTHPSDVEIQTNEWKQRTEDDWREEQVSSNILELFLKIPGCNNGMIDEVFFYSWIDEASRFAEQTGYVQSFDMCLGKLLSYTPSGSDAIFPHEIVRNFFEKNTSNIVVNEFISGKESQRGVHTVTGGLEEKNISERYKNYATILKIKYPRTSAVLLKLSEQYLHESQFNQNREMVGYC